MPMKHPRQLFAAAAILLASSQAGLSQGAAENLREIFGAKEIPVTVENFVRAATDIEFAKYTELAGGVNKLFHIGEPTPIDQQPTIRMNRDTLYSMAVIDITEGATLTIPDPGDRYVSTQIVNQDHFMNKVFLGGGSFELDKDTFTTPHVVAIVRLLVDANDPEDIEAVHQIQEGMILEAGSSIPFIAPSYDEESFEEVRQAALQLSRFIGDSRDTFGPEGEVNQIRHFLGAAFGWGGLPEEDAFYLAVEPRLPVGEFKLVVPADVPVDAFWSVSLYNRDGFFEENKLGVHNINSVTGIPNDDGSKTIHFGGCGDGRVNCLPIMEGWNYAVRLYRPGDKVLDGTWEFPSVQEVQ